MGLGEGALDLLRDLLRDFGWLKPRPKKRQKSQACTTSVAWQAAASAAQDHSRPADPAPDRGSHD